MQTTYRDQLYEENDVFVAQCIEVDVASQGATPVEALTNLKEALELHFEVPVATVHGAGEAGHT